MLLDQSQVVTQELHLAVSIPLVTIVVSSHVEIFDIS